MIMLLPIAFAVLIIAALTTSATTVRAVSRLWLRHWIETRQGDPARLSRYFERPTRLVHAAVTGIALTEFTVGALLVMQDGARSWILVRDGVVFIVLVLLFGQLLPRAIGRRWAPRIVPFAVPLLRVVDIAVTPFLAVAAFVSRIIRRRSARSSDSDAREGLEELLREGAFEGMRATEEMAIISGVMQFGEKAVRDVMTPRNEMFVLDGALPADVLARAVAGSGYSRVPVYHESPDRIVGMLYAFDVFKSAGARVPNLRPVSLTSPMRPANELLFEMLRARRQLAIVQDEAGLVQGLVTMEDLLEELVGEISDEHDEPATRPQDAH